MPVVWCPNGRNFHTNRFWFVGTAKCPWDRSFVRDTCPAFPENPRKAALFRIIMVGLTGHALRIRSITKHYTLRTVQFVQGENGKIRESLLNKMPWLFGKVARVVQNASFGMLIDIEKT